MPETNDKFEELKRRCKDLEVENQQLKKTLGKVSISGEISSDLKTRYLSYFEQSLDGIVIIDPEDFSFFEFNNQSCKQLGYNREEFSKLNLFDIEIKEASSETSEKVNKICEETKLEYNTQHKTKSGKIRDIYVSEKSIKISGKLYIQAIWHDITAIKNNQQLLLKIKESEQRLKIATISGQLGIWDWKIKEDRIEWDERMLELYRVTRQSFSNTFEGWKNLVHPDDRDFFENELKIAINGEKDFNITFRVLHANGKIHYIKADGIVIRNSEDEPIRMIGINKDVTESKIAEQEISLRESYLKAIIENQPGLIWLKDIESRFLTVNNAFLQACGQENIINKNDLDIWPKELALSYIKDDKSVISEKKHKIIEEPISEKNEIKWFETFKAPVFNSNGEIIGTTGYSRDITERKKEQMELLKAKEKAEESDRLKTAFLQNMSHEIRTPMNAIMGFADLIKDSLNDKSKLIKYSEIINTRCYDLLDIINDILDIAKIESGLLAVNYEECILNDLFTEISSFFREYQKRLGKENIIFILAPLNEKIIIKTDKVKLKQIFINLITNALKFTEEGTIQVGFEITDEKFVQFFVRDTGKGIPADKQSLIFERFIQLDEFSNSNISGTGLGLPIVKGLINLLGGEIGLESELNKGSTFSFTIPYILTNLSKKVVVENNVVSKFNGKTVLIVEDDKFNAEYINEILSATGLKILIASTGKQAIDMVQSQAIDLILMDIRLPDTNGYEITKYILTKNPSVKIIAQTAYASSEEKNKAFLAGCLDYISKPIKSNLLLRKMNSLLSA